MAICPLIAKCDRSVSFNHYREVCSNITEDSYTTCEHFMKLTSENKLPRVV